MVFYQEEKGGRFTIIETDEHYTQIVAVPERSDTVLRLTLVRTVEGTFLYLVGNDQENTSVVDVSRLAMMSWSVIASGIKGSAFCSNEPTSMPRL